MLSVQMDPQSRLLTIVGEHFGATRLPRVTLDADLLTVREATDARIIAGPVSPKVDAGQHLLRVVAGHDRSRFDALRLDLDAAMAAHEQGTDMDSGAIRIRVLDAGGDVGWLPAVGVAAGGRPIIAYLDYSNADLKLAACADADCSDVRLSLIDSAGSLGGSAALAIAAEAQPSPASTAKGRWARIRRWHWALMACRSLPITITPMPTSRWRTAETLAVTSLNQTLSIRRVRSAGTSASRSVPMAARSSPTMTRPMAT